MNIVVLYDSKRGVTEESAKKISDSLKCDNYNLRKSKHIELNKYDLIIIGTPLYFGMPMKAIKNFCNKNETILKTKKTAFFLCGVGPADEMISLFKSKLNSDIVSNISIISHFGGELRPDRARFLMRTMMTKMLDDPKFKSNIKGNEINKFIDDVKEIR